MAVLQTWLAKGRRHLSPLGITRGDLLLITGLLALCAASFFLIRGLLPAPQSVVVRVDGVEIARLPLDTDTVYEISDGNTIEISDGGVRMIAADCPNKVCMHTGRITRSGQSIVCAPHRVTVTIAGSGSADAYDIQTR